MFDIRDEALPGTILRTAVQKRNIAAAAAIGRNFLRVCTAAVVVLAAASDRIAEPVELSFCPVFVLSLPLWFCGRYGLCPSARPDDAWESVFADDARFDVFAFDADDAGRALSE